MEAGIRFNINGQEGPYWRDENFLKTFMVIVVATVNLLKATGLYT
jgi:hypothetical protein